MAMKVANNMGVYNMVVPSILNTVDMFHAIFGPGLLESTSATLNKLSGQAIPTWNKCVRRSCSSHAHAPPLPAVRRQEGVQRGALRAVGDEGRRIGKHTSPDEEPSRCPSFTRCTYVRFRGLLIGMR